MNEVQETIETEKHIIHYTAHAEEWFCIKCGARGLDGENSPSEVVCQQ